MVSWIPTGGQTEIESLGDKFSQAKDFPPGPGEEVIFVLESGPGGDKRDYFDARPKAKLQILGVRFCQERDREFFTRRLEESGGDD